MSGAFSLLIEAAILLAIYLLAALAASPVRARPGRGAPGAFRRLGACVARPLAVLALTALAVAVARWHPAAAAWLGGRGDHVRAWQTVWLVVLVLSALEGLALELYRVRGRAFPVPDLLLNMLRLAVLLSVVFAVLRLQLGINITGLLASTALITAVVGFALQGVLGNLLAGMSLHVVRSVLPGDWVAVGAVEGEVIQTNWRETRLRTTHGHILVIPNSTVAAEILHNMSRPTPLRRHVVGVGASYSDAPGDVIEALVEAARGVPAVLGEPPPSAYVTEFKDFGINYQLRFWTNRYHDRVPVDGDVQRMIWYQFKRRGIEIPFPMSDKLLNDFMEVVYHQRRLPPEPEEVRRNRADLLRSDFAAKLLTDEQGQQLLQESALEGIAESLRRVQYTRGETVFPQGAGGQTCYVVSRGTLRGRVEYRDASQASEFDLGPGALFGEMSLVTGLPRTATVTAMDEVELVEIGKETFTTLLSLRADIPERLAQLVAKRAAANASALEKLKALEGARVSESLRRDSILQRFLRMLKS